MNKQEQNGLRMFCSIDNKLNRIKKRTSSKINDVRIKIYTELRDEYKKYKSLYMKEWRKHNEKNKTKSK